MSFERITKVRLPFDKRHSDPRKNYGIHGLDVWFILKGKKGATQFMVNVGVYLPHLRTGRERLFGEGEINGYDVGYHALEPQYEGQEAMDHCDVFEGRKCYYDGSSLRADDWAKEIFSIRGENPEKRLWEKLEEEYKEMFGDE
jgi:hypothetical protein